MTPAEGFSHDVALLSAAEHVYSQNCAREYLRKVLPVLGLVPFCDGPRTAAKPLKCGPRVALPVPRKLNPKGTRLREGGRVPSTSEESTKTPRTRFPLCFLGHLCVGLPHRESCELSCGLKPVPRFQCPGACRGSRCLGFRCPGATGYQFWGWCPVKLEKPFHCGRPRGELPRRQSPVEIPRPRTCSAQAQRPKGDVQLERASEHHGSNSAAMNMPDQVYT